MSSLSLNFDDGENIIRKSPSLRSIEVEKSKMKRKSDDLIICYQHILKVFLFKIPQFSCLFSKIPLFKAEIL